MALGLCTSVGTFFGFRRQSQTLVCLKSVAGLSASLLENECRDIDIADLVALEALSVAVAVAVRRVLEDVLPQFQLLMARSWLQKGPVRMQSELDLALNSESRTQKTRWLFSPGCSGGDDEACIMSLAHALTRHSW